MNKNVIIGLFVAVAAVGTAIVLNKSDQGIGPIVGGGDYTNPSLVYVPEDTLFYFGGAEPIPLKKIFLTSLSASMAPINEEMIAQHKQAAADSPDAFRLYAEFMTDYFRAFKSPQTFVEGYGIAEKGSMSWYTVGSIPVFRASIGDSGKFEAKLDELEQRAGITKNVVNDGQLRIRHYGFGVNEHEIKMVIAVDDKDAIITFDAKDFDDNQRNMALGKQLPDKSLAQSSRLSDLINEHKFLPGYVGYLSHEEIVRGLTEEKGGQLANLLSVLNKNSNDDSFKQGLANLRSEGCRSDLQQWVKNWPRTVGGVTKVSWDKPMSMETTMMLESHDSELMTGLASIRGFVPEYASQVSSKAIAALGVGVSIDKFFPFITAFSEKIRAKEYRCDIFQSFKESMAKANPMALGMFAGMMAGVEGISLSVLDFDVAMDSPGMPNVKKFDGMVAISAKDPNTLVQSLKAFNPMMATMEIPSNGEAVDIPVPVPGVSPKLAIKGSHIVLYSGEQAQNLATTLGDTSLTANGFWSMNLDYGKYYQLLGDIVKKQMPQNSQNSFFDSISSTNMRVITDVDFKQKGIVFSSSVFY